MLRTYGTTGGMSIAAAPNEPRKIAVETVPQSRSPHSAPGVPPRPARAAHPRSPPLGPRLGPRSSAPAWVPAPRPPLGSPLLGPRPSAPAFPKGIALDSRARSTRRWAPSDARRASTASLGGVPGAFEPKVMPRRHPGPGSPCMAARPAAPRRAGPFPALPARGLAPSDSTVRSPHERVARGRTCAPQARHRAAERTDASPGAACGQSAHRSVAAQADTAQIGRRSAQHATMGPRPATGRPRVGFLPRCPAWPRRAPASDSPAAVWARPGRKV